jgi:membrane-bound lytic murein transglycosylase B
MSLRIKLFALLFPILAFLFLSVGYLARPASMETLNIAHRGGTLFGIAKTFHISTATRKVSDQPTSDFIHTHQNIHIAQSAPVSAAQKPYAAFYTVQHGDTLWQLAAENHLTVSRLVAINHLHSTVIRPGQKLQVFEGTQSTWQKIQIKKYQKVGIPLKLIPIYQAAGHKYGIPWTVLAAIHHQETHFSTGHAVSCAGAQGPMQFMPATFRYYGVRAPGHQGSPDINNVYDAIYTCAHMLKSVGYAKNPSHAIYMYNHSMHYVEAVVRTAHHFAV